MADLPDEQGLSFRFDLTSRSLMANFQPVPDAAPIDEEWLRATLGAMGWGQLRYDPDAIADLLRHYAHGEPFADLSLAQCVDAALEIFVSADKLTAQVSLRRPEGGEALSVLKVMERLAEKGICEGLLPDAIAEVVAAGEASERPVALGSPPVDGQDGWLECLLPATRSRVPRVDEAGNVDYRDLGDILAVHAGEPLMRRHAPTPGEDGIDVLGQVIPAKAGKDARFASKLPGTTCAPDDADLLLAKVGGQPVVVPDGMIVEAVYTVESVNAATGNIRFDGSVVIKGDVMAGMTVQASGDIEVGGVVEAAMVDAGGCIVIKGGAIGSVAHNAKLYLRCGGSFSAGYASQARVVAGDSIYVDDVAMACDLAAENAIRLGGVKRGHLVGGKARASYAISAKVIGSPTQVKTVLEIGAHAAADKALHDIVQQREMHESQLFELSKVLDVARKVPGKIPVEKVELARKMAASLTVTILGLREQQSALEQQIERARRARVVAERAFFEGVEIWHGTQRFCVAAEQRGGAVGSGGDGLQMFPLEDVFLDDDQSSP